MEVATLIARVVLAVILIVAGATKIANRPRARQSLIEFGVRQSWIPSLIWLLPVSEVMTALALIWTRTSWSGSIAALCLFLVFSGGIAYNLALGNRPECNCFGQLGSTRVGPRTIARNTLLAFVAAALVVQPTPAMVALSPLELRFLLVVVLVLGAALATLFALTIEVVRRHDQLASRLEDLQDFLSSDTFQPPSSPPEMSNQHLPIGAPAPDFNLPGLDGHQITLKELIEPDKPLLIFFLSSDCGPCSALIPEIDLWRHELNRRFNFLVISKGSIDSIRSKFAVPVLLDEVGAVAIEYRAKWTPAAVLVTGHGAIGSQMAFGNQQIRALLDHVIESETVTPWFSTSNENAAADSTPKIGDPAPAILLPDSAGHEVDLVHFSGCKTLVLFWGPNCGFCQEILEDLQQWERGRTADEPRLVVISRGDATSHEEMNLQSPIVFDPDLLVSRAFGSPGTPSAILIDGEGKVASVLGSGADEVLALAGYRRSRK